MLRGISFSGEAERGGQVLDERHRDAQGPDEAVPVGPHEAQHQEQEVHRSQDVQGTSGCGYKRKDFMGTNVPQPTTSIIDCSIL